MSKMKRLRWKYCKATNSYEAKIKGNIAFSIQGCLCVTDLRACYSSDVFIPPSHYKISSVVDGKQIAYELLNNLNIKVNEANRLAWVKKDEETAKLIADAEALINQLQNDLPCN